MSMTHVREPGSLSHFIWGLKRWWADTMQLRKMPIECKEYPIRVALEPTNLCNLRCPMCPVSNPKPGAQRGFMDFDLYKKLVDQASEFAVDITLVGGGEPMLHPQIIDFIKYAKSKKMRVRMDSNATLITKEKAKALIESKLDFLSLSLDGYDKQSYESIRVGGTFEETIKNIRGFLKLKEEMHSNDPYTLLQFIDLPTTMKISEEEKRAFRESFRTPGLNGFRLVQPHNWGGWIPEEDIQSKYAWMGHDKNIEKHISYRPCFYPWVFMQVLWNGKVVSCGFDQYGDQIMGDSNVKSLKKIWNDEPFKNLRKNQLTGNYKKMPLCSGCDYLWQKTNKLGISEKNIYDGLLFVRENLNIPLKNQFHAVK